MPALLKGFLEQALRPNFAFAEHARNRLPKKLLAGKSARVVVTMGMPSLFFRLVYRARGLKSLESNILAFCGIAPIRDNVIGKVDSMTAAERGKWLERMIGFGQRAC
jgi:putative NADPH-quinone reductase